MLAQVAGAPRYQIVRFFSDCGIGRPQALNAAAFSAKTGMFGADKSESARNSTGMRMAGVSRTAGHFSLYQTAGASVLSAPVSPRKKRLSG